MRDRDSYCNQPTADLERLLMGSHDFDSAVRQALENIHDFVALRPTALAEMLVPDATDQDRGAACSQRLAQALELLKPKADDEDGWVLMRYHILYSRYIERRKSEDAASHLSVSRRHFFRLLGRAVAEYAVLLRDEIETQHKSDALQSNTETPPVVVPQGRLGTVGEITDRIHEMLSARLAERGVTLTLEIAPGTRNMQVDQELVRQLFMGLIGHYMACGAQHIRITAHDQENSAVVRVCWDQLDTDVPEESLAEYMILARNHGIDAKIDRQSRCCILYLAKRERLILVADDEERACRLLCRYLGIAGYRTLTARDGTTALALAREHKPDAITLDLMMGGEDGWDVLQKLTMDSETVSIPVLVCSALDQKELATLMGATFFVKKPIARERLLDCLAQVC